MSAVTRLRTLGCLLGSLATVVCPIGQLAAQQTRQISLRIMQDTSVVQEIRLQDGTKLVGRIARITGDDVTFRTLGGLDLQLQRRDVGSIRELHGVRVGNEFWPEDPSNSRLFVAPTARVARHGRGYFGIYELVVPSFAVGVGDFAMVSGGFSIVPGIDLDDQAFYIAPKVQLFNARYVQGAVGLVWVKPGDEQSGGLIYSTVTAGDTRASFSGGLALTYDSDDGLGDQAVVMLGGELRASRQVKLITESWFVPGEEGALLSLGLRIIRSRLTVEAAAITSSEGGFFPLVNFSLAW